MGEWADLPLDLLISIAKRIDLYEDFVAFGGVCRSWRPVAAKENFNLSAGIPWLMLPAAESGRGETSSNSLQGFVSVTKGDMVRKLELPKARGRRCISSKGWLITMDSATYEMELLHPLTRVWIPLPHPRTYKYNHEDISSEEMKMHRAVLSASPSLTEDYVVMVILGGTNVGVWKPGNNIWTVIETQPAFWIVDVVYYKDQFYAIDRVGDLLLCNLISCTSQIVARLPSTAKVVTAPAYLVECDSELLVVLMETKRDIQFDVLCFKVFKFDQTNSEKYYYSWKEIGDFGGRSIFVSCWGAAVCAGSAAVAITKPNCIYFADGHTSRYVTINPSGEKKKWECRIKSEFNKTQDLSAPVWVLPSF